MAYPSTTQTLAGVIAECPSAADLMSELGVDCGRHARDSLQRVCEDEGLDPHLTLEVILSSNTRQPAGEREDWSAVPIEELADHIVAVHHTYLRKQLPKLQLLIDKALHDEPVHVCYLDRIRRRFDEIRQELNRSMIAQEQICFPAIRQLSHALRRRGGTVTIDRPIGSICPDCNSALHGLERLGEECDGFTAPQRAGAAYQALMHQMQAFEADLRTHHWLEHEVLLPRAVAMEAQLVGTHQWQPRNGGVDTGSASPPP